MPVPPQESAPSLSPRQSFGCQSPLPWVTGTDRTGSLRALWQLQGSFQEFSSPSAHSLTWRSRSQANKPHAVQYCVVTTTHGENTDKGFPKRFSSHRMISRHDFGTGSTHRLAQLFPNNQGFFHSSSTQGSHFRNAHTGFLRTDTDSQLWTGCTRFLQDKHRLYCIQRLHQVSCRLSSTGSCSEQFGSNG
jgi:hypothetical protein